MIMQDCKNPFKEEPSKLVMVFKVIGVVLAIPVAMGLIWINMVLMLSL